MNTAAALQLQMSVRREPMGTPGSQKRHDWVRQYHAQGTAWTGQVLRGCAPGSAAALQGGQRRLAAMSS